MKEEGYYIDHLNLGKEISDYQAKLIDLVQMLEKEGTEKVKEIIPDIESQIKDMYDQLEKEALAKNYVDSKMPNYEKALQNFEKNFLHTQSEVEQLKQAYYFEDADLEKYMTLEKLLQQLKEQLKELTEKVEKNNEAHSHLREELEAAFEQLERIENEHEQFKERIAKFTKR